MTLRHMMDMIVIDALLCDSRLTPTDIKVYMHMYGYHEASLRARARASRIPRETLRRSVHHLVQLGWACEVPWAGKTRPVIAPSMPLDVEQAVADELQRVRNDVPNMGEWLMKCMLDMMVTDNDYHDNARPSWLTSGTGGGRMEIDRWYRSANVALEFQGPQHYRVAGPYSPSEHALGKQMAHDNLKAGLCVREGIQFVEITAGDLQYRIMSNKIGELLPLRSVQEDRPVFRTLARMCQAYINYAAREEKRAYTHSQ